MKKISIALSLLVVLLFTGCFGWNRIYTEFSNVKNTTVDEKNVAVIYNDFPEASHAGCINDIYFSNKSTGKFEAIYHDTDLKPKHFTRKFLLLPGTYNIFYSYDYYGTRKEADKGHGRVNLKAGHKYRVEHETCDGSFYRKFCTSGIWLHDLTTGELLSGKRQKFVFPTAP